METLKGNVLFTKTLSLFVYVCNNLCIIYIHGRPYMELFRAVDNHAKLCAVSSLNSVSIVLPIISAFVISTRHSLSHTFVISAMNHMIFLGSNKIMCTLKT